MRATTASKSQRLVEPDRASAIIARSIFRELKDNGYSRDQVVSVAGELISLVASDIEEPLPSPA